MLELLKDLALVDHGIVFLEQEGIIDRLEEMLRRVDSDPLISFLLPGTSQFINSHYPYRKSFQRKRYSRLLELLSL